MTKKIITETAPAFTDDLEAFRFLIYLMDRSEVGATLEAARGKYQGAIAMFLMGDHGPEEVLSFANEIAEDFPGLV